MDVGLPTQALRDRWEDVESDLEATAGELAAEGWTAVTLHAGDATTVPPGRDASAGLDVLVPGDEFEALESMLADGATFSETVVFRQAAGGVSFVVCVFRDPDRELAALVPAFYPQLGTDARALAAQAHDDGTLAVHVHPLDRSRVVTFGIDDPGLVFPTE